MFSSLAAFLAVYIPVSAGQGVLIFEAEDVSSPLSAWLCDITPTDCWNLWSQDVDADRKWSGGKVLQSPPVLVDRQRPEDGAPVLHTVLTGIPPGRWEVRVKYGRALAVSLDGATWRDISPDRGLLGRFDITNGQFEFWVDDGFADPVNPGFSYYDCVVLTPALPEANGVVNGDFEAGTDMPGSGWSWWSREGVGSAAFSAEAHHGARGVRLAHEGERDWAFTNSGRISVQPGQQWTATAWVKCTRCDEVELAFVAYSQGRLLNWNIASDSASGTTDWVQLKAVAVVPDACDELVIRFVGYGATDVLVDEVSVQGGEPATLRGPKPSVTGWAKERIQERLGRGLVPVRLPDGSVYLSWRLLRDDPSDIGFHVYRRAGETVLRLTDVPVTATTDFVDALPSSELDLRYFIRPVVHGEEGEASAPTEVIGASRGPGCKVIRLQGDYTFQKVGIADLNGDGEYDFVIKQPNVNIDPYGPYWQPSPGTYKLEAYLSDGTFLWRYDLGWAIEQGIWYSPYVVYDLDGDGRAEVAVKTGEGDPRDEDGRVREGPEYLSILDGMTGQEKARVDWPSREGFPGGTGGYNLASRNQIGIAYLDGKTPCLLAARGTYATMKLVAYQYQDGVLSQLWSWNDRESGPKFRGQGAHWMHSGDVDGDERDEVVLGSCVIDDNGDGLWSTGLGHPDRCFLGDLDPSRPGLELAYSIETAQPRNGVCMVDAVTGAILWGLGDRTYHVGYGVAADIDPLVSGQEYWAGEDPKGDPEGQGYRGAPPRWLFSAAGELLARDGDCPGFGGVVWWDADWLRELISGERISKYRGPVVQEGIVGSQAAWADILGDWREEIITSVPGELRIYTTTLPATDRRVCLMQDPIYRADVAHLAMGYAQPPTLGYYLGPLGPGALSEH